jgi:aspartate aminotransferase
MELMEIIDFSSGASYFKSPETAINAAINALQAGKTSYGPTEGILALRQAIAARYQNATHLVTSSQILITPGSKQALFNLFSVLLKENDEVIIPTPAWFGFNSLMQYSKGILITLPTSLSDNYAITPKALKKVITQQTRILLLTNPGNPTGRLYTKDELEALVAVTADYPDLYIISDEIYDFDTYGKSFTSILSCKGIQAERTCVVNGFSKTFSMSGWRAGYIVGPQTLIEKCIDFQGSTLSGVSIFVQEAAVNAFQERENALAPMVAVLTDHRQIMQQHLAAIPDIKFYSPDGAYYFFPDMSAYLGKTTPSGNIIDNAVALCHYLNTQYHLQVSPGDNFGAPGHVRMSFAVERPLLLEGLNRFKKALDSLI